MAELEEDYEKRGVSGAGSDIGYSVEVRYSFHTPTKIGDVIYDKKWRRLHCNESELGIGVPTGPRYSEAGKRGLYSYAAAEALRWWFLANLEINHRIDSLCFETRIVSHVVKFSYEIEADEQHSLIKSPYRPLDK